MAQLRMRFKARTDFPIPALPDGFQLTTLNPDKDIMGWIETCAEGLGITEWSPADFQKNMLDPEGLSPEQIFVIKTDDGQVVATATAWDKGSGNGYVHMVAARPEYRGKALGVIVCKAVMDWLDSHGITRILLWTDDFRLPAIKTYLRLGFLPELFDFDMETRWKAILPKLDMTSAVYRCEYVESEL